MGGYTEWRWVANAAVVAILSASAFIGYSAYRLHRFQDECTFRDGGVPMRTINDTYVCVRNPDIISSHHWGSGR